MTYDWPLWTQVALGVVVGLAAWATLRRLARSADLKLVALRLAAWLLATCFATCLLFVAGLDLRAQEQWLRYLHAGGVGLVTLAFARGALALFTQAEDAAKDKTALAQDRGSVPLLILGGLAYGALAFLLVGFAYRSFLTTMPDGSWYPWLWY